MTSTGPSREGSSTAPGFYVLLAVALSLIALLAWVYTSWDSLAPEPAKAFAAGEKISGANQGYKLTFPDDTWLPMPAGRRAENADLELSGQNGEAILAVFAGCDRGATLDFIVDSRRSEKAGKLANLEVSEERRFDAASFVPISVARYWASSFWGAARPIGSPPRSTASSMSR